MSYSIEDCPVVLREGFEYYARKVLAAGRTRFSAEMIINRMRWYAQIETNDPDYKINNNWKKPLAEDLMRRCPEFAGFFETRERRDDV